MRRLERTPIPVVAASHSGMKRKENEDRFGVAAFSLGPRGPQPVLLAVLCDGIGGHRAGEVAAELAVNIVSQVVADSDALNPPRILTQAIETASDAIRDQAIAINEQSGMGATCACAWLVGERLYSATVADSRVYLLRGERIQRVSTDHTWIQEALERGMLRPEQISGHPNAHIIRRYLGSPVAPEVDLRLRVSGEESDEQALANQGTLLLPSDRILLTSDGLTDLVSDIEILEAFQQQPAETSCKRLLYQSATFMPSVCGLQATQQNTHIHSVCSCTDQFTSWI
jgi:protein phosphatase